MQFNALKANNRGKFNLRLMSNTILFFRKGIGPFDDTVNLILGWNGLRMRFAV